MKRLVVYFHYDAQGQIDAPCRFAVQALLPLADLLFVTNGRLQAADRAWAQGTGARLLERENTGYDVGAYREALRTLGRTAVAAYDELVLMNYTLAGPVCPLTPMFAAMQARPELDFWGLTRHYAMRSSRFGGQVPEHLQSHFLVVRARMLRSDAFWQYWQQIRLPHSYEESVACHEARFTAHFAALGWRWDTYVDTADLAAVFVNPIMACPQELLAHRGCPFFKRRSFFTPYTDELRRTDGQAARVLYDYLKTRTDINLYARSLTATIADIGDWAYFQNGDWVKGWSGAFNDDVRFGNMKFADFLTDKKSAAETAINGMKIVIKGRY